MTDLEIKLQIAKVHEELATIYKFLSEFLPSSSVARRMLEETSPEYLWGLDTSALKQLLNAKVQSLQDSATALKNEF